MNIDEFMEHGWILNDDIPDTVLFTPERIADDVSYWICDSASYRISVPVVYVYRYKDKF